MNRPLVAVIAVVVAASGCGKNSGSTGGRSGDPPPASDSTKLQGVWGVVGMDAGTRLEDFPADEVAREMERMRQGRFRFEGGRLTINMFGQEARFRFSVDESKSPKVMTITDPRAGEPHQAPKPGTARSSEDLGPPREPVEWIYAFENDVLVIAVPKGAGSSRPTEFKAKPRQPDGTMVTVIRMTKTDAPPKSDPGPLHPVTVPRR